MGPGSQRLRRRDYASAVSAGIRSAWKREAEGGFTLSELLIVVSVILLITLITIPNLPVTRMQANEVSAIQALRNIYAAEVQYQATYPSLGFACALPTLGGAGQRGTPVASTAEAAGLLPAEVASGQKSGYMFQLAHCGRSGADGGAYTSFEVTATPKAVGKTGHRGFCIDERGDAKADPAGGSNCTQSLQ